jgi:tetratricopeptide (TPR) repeat protein
LRFGRKGRSAEDPDRPDAPWDPGEPPLSKIAKSAAAILLSVFPILGAPVSQFLSDAATSAEFDRVWAFASDLANQLKNFETRKLDYVRTDEFQQLLVRGLRAALMEADAQERQSFAATLARPIWAHELPRVWNVPLLRNPHFQSRERELVALREVLGSTKTVGLVQVVQGEGGVGKTQLVLEYCYRYHADFGMVWWLPAEDPAALSAAYAALAAQIDELKGVGFPDQATACRSIRRWLESNGGWLLIFDNAVEFAEVEEYLPRGGSGHSILTSRNPAWQRLGRQLSVGLWPSDASVCFLVGRAGKSDYAAAKLVADLLQNLPLALEHAAAYLEATGCSLAEYARLLGQHGLALLDDTRAVRGLRPVSATWSLVLERLREENTSALALIRTLAYVAPEEFPLAAVQLGLARVSAVSASFNDSQSVNAALAALRRYGLVSRNESGIRVHAVVQHAVRSSTDEAASREAVGAAAALVKQALPRDASKPPYFPLCSSLIPHVRFVAGYALQLGVGLDDMGAALDDATTYLNAVGRYREAEHFARQALAIHEETLGPADPSVAISLGNLVKALSSAGDYQEAESVARRGLAVVEGALNPEHPDVAACLNNLATVLWQTGRYIEAEPLLRRAIGIDKRTLGLEDPRLASSLNNLATVLRDTGRYQEAEELLRRTVEIDENAFGGEDPSVAVGLNSLAGLLLTVGRHQEAEPLARRALAITEKALGLEHPNVSDCLENLAKPLWIDGYHAEAEQLLRRALAIDEKVLGPDHPAVAERLNNLAAVAWKTSRHGEAEDLLRRGIRVSEKALGPEHPNVAASLNNLASLLEESGHSGEAELLLRRAIRINEKAVGPDHPNVVLGLKRLAVLLANTGRFQEAKTMALRANAIDEANGRLHSDTE